MIGRSGARRIRRKSSLRRGRGLRRTRMRNLAPFLKLGGLVAGAAAILAVLVIFVIIPLFSAKTEPVSQTSAPPTPKPTPIIQGSIADNAEELTSITQDSINDPYIYGGKIVFTTGEDASNINKVEIYDLATKETNAVSGITKKYSNLFEPKINDKYIVYLDCKNDNGGAVCGYDIEAGKSFVIREYIAGKPRVSLAGKYALWLQRTAGQSIDKLYLFDLETKQSATIDVFVGTAFFISSAYMSDDYIVFVQPDGQQMIINTETSSALDKAQIAVMPLADKGDAQRAMFTPGTYVYRPMVSGNDIVYMTGSGDRDSALMYVSFENGTFSSPVEITKNVLNYCVGDGYVVYTQDDKINIYYFKDGSTGLLSPENTRALLSSASGKDVIWYDITDSSSGAGDIVMHIVVP